MTIKDPSREGTMMTMVQLPWPWPVARAVTIIEQKQTGYFFKASCESTGRISARLTDASDSNTVLAVESCPLVLTEPAFLFLSVTWELPDDMRIHVRDALVASAKTPSDVPEIYEIPIQSNVTRAEREDFTRDNATALIRRRGTIGGAQPRRGRIAGTEETAIQSLREETAQIEDKLKLLDSGATHHARGLANSVGLLVAVGTPMPLIQICAAHRNAPLVMYTSARPNTAISKPPDASISYDMSAEPTVMTNNPIDLDVWLALEAVYLDGKPFTHRQVIKGIRNTVGSHVDYDILPLIDFLRSSALSAATGGADHDMFVKYVRKVALVARRLAQNLLQS